MKFPQLIGLDFDGVVVESNQIKDRAAENLFKDYPQHFAAMMDFHLNHNALPRQRKFRRILQEILKPEKVEPILSNWLFRFQKDTRQAVIECPMVNGAQEFLESFRDQLPLYLISATPQEELDIIVDARKLRGFFRQVLGASLHGSFGKQGQLLSILEAEALKASDTLYIGDSPEDYSAASAVGMAFIGRKGKSSFQDAPFLVFNDLREIKGYLEGIDIDELPGKSI